MKIENILHEGISKVLYHHTSIGNAISIIENDQFRLTLAAGSDNETKITPSLYYLSTARNKSGSYSREPDNANVTLVLDGQQLSYNYSGKAVNYFHAVNNDDWSTDKDEMEDRVFSDKPHINDAAKYIRAIHVYINPSFKSRDNMQTAKWDRHQAWVSFSKLATKAKLVHIPIYVYEDMDAWQHTNTKKSLPITDKMPEMKRDRNYKKPPISFNIKDRINPYIELYHKKDYTKLGKEAKFVLNKLYHDTNSSDLLNSYLAYVKYAPEIHKGIIDIWRKEKIRSSEAFIELLKDKWRDL